MFDLELSYTVLLIICLLAACGFEFVNGFHDTANAVATVIYTNSLKPWVAVVWSGICNAIGVFLGGITVAMGIVNLLPVESLVDQNIAHSLAMVMALLLSAIFWNLLTWYFGIPCSSSHTLIGSILGVGLAYSLLPDANEAAVNWGKAQEIGASLLISPLFGFSLTIILMFLLRTLTKNTSAGDGLFKEPKKNQPPPWWIRIVLILTCTAVSGFHGSNDGQKGVGLVMLILIGIVPAYFALNPSFQPSKLSDPLKKIELTLNRLDGSPLAQSDKTKLDSTKVMTARLLTHVSGLYSVSSIASNDRFLVRKDIMLLNSHIKSLSGNSELVISEADKKALSDNMKSVRKITDYSPQWVIVMIAFSLGLGTMIGWKRIVKTIGEKIGKEHLTYAQGASAELVASTTIGLSTAFGLPVSTTHVLSSGIAGSMVASKGIKNLQPDTVRNILIAWLLTLPVVMVMAGTLFLIFRATF
ncbi:MAG TPA: inorganic phosphate transporter [Cyclobacteriaceae bacterium]|jgi:phosphate/sulfate permease|nr:inorganic phosphate transporter [Cytophagales bacterium]HNT50365.1 inorganic phosphate transporter [Cyclobacteriaceae bacterium]HRE66230.1 inorganic phosphate transporter [Cyclobacteriaceae bacterium]HRF34043.1 inorganic phosphate transporter [Cyclobacteriaceae bacterium]